MKTVPTHFESSWRSLLAGGAGSVLLHLALFLIVGLSLRGCQKIGMGEPGGEPYRDVGLIVLDGADGGSADIGKAPGAGDDPKNQPSHDQIAHDQSQNDTANGEASTSQRLPTEAPDITDLLNNSEHQSAGAGDSSSKLPALIGPGDPIGGIQRPAQGGGSKLIAPQDAGGAAKLGGIGGPGDTTFMDVAATGKTFVYLIDSSSSMYGGRLKIAQSQLKKSLRLLQPNQQFGVIFYNEYREILTLPGQSSRKMYFASELNKQSAAREVDRIVPNNGTEHKAALLEALMLKPDVDYLLTDGEEPELYEADLKEVARHTGTTTIHVIKFGDGTVSSRETSWLQRLARQSDGEFREFKVDP